MMDQFRLAVGSGLVEDRLQMRLYGVAADREQRTCAFGGMA